MDARPAGLFVRKSPLPLPDRCGQINRWGRGNLGVAELGQHSGCGGIEGPTLHIRPAAIGGRRAPEAPRPEIEYGLDGGRVPATGLDRLVPPEAVQHGPGPVHDGFWNSREVGDVNAV